MGELWRRLELLVDGLDSEAPRSGAPTGPQ